MDRILILDDVTINRIAAGEVVERPASIMKELVENSIDAKASAITMEIRDGGKSYIRVTDNGRGMSPGDARTSFQRHATSKIGSPMDLDSIFTLGFRGEALASIAAVTQMEMITREKDSSCGIQIVNNGGNLVTEKEIGCPEGTTIIAENLFFNTPARLKFLKTHRAETAHISEIVSKLILAHPEISFKYINNGRMVYHSPGDGNLKHAILSIYGRETVGQILAIDRKDTPMGISLWGYMGKPSLARKSRGNQSFFVNGRYVKSNLLEKWVETAYKPYLTINLFPWIVLHLVISPKAIDVNVHPAKTEIRFREEKIVGPIIQEYIESILEENPYIPMLMGESFSQFKGLDKDNGSHQMEVFSSISEHIIGDDAREIKRGLSFDAFQAQESIQNPYVSYEQIANIKDDQEHRGGINSMNDDNTTRDIEILSSLRVVGEIFATYIIVEGPKQCFLIDQHAAHERLLFERYKEMLSKRAVAIQQLLPPTIIEVTHTEQIMINESMDIFDLAGFEIENFGGRSFAVRGVPMILGSSNIRVFFEELLYNAEEYRQTPNYKLKIDDVIRMSCRGAIKAGNTLSKVEILALLKDMIQERIPMTCPHGRPIMISLTMTELEKMFKRIQ